ncbi:MAG TPA: alanine racemase [Clostridia bacterium]|nr:alanine racemase [Clostridia bacterium]
MMGLGDAWQEIDLDALRHNAATALSLAGDAEVFAVVKADAYGHGAARMAETLLKSGIRTLAVSCLREALFLRRRFPEAGLLVMGATPDALLDRAVAGDIALALFSLEQGQALSRAACALGKTASVHLKLDTGFHRLGMTEAEALRDIPKIARLPGLAVEGLFTHLALLDAEHDRAQMAVFERVAAGLRAQGIAPRLHVGDSIALVRYPQWRLDAVRVGALLYGARPGGSEAMDFALRCTMRVCARIIAVRDIPAGDAVGYAHFVARRPTRIATLPIGYADGLSRCLWQRGQAALRGRRVPYAGLPCMDQIMLDVTDVPEAQAGDIVTLFGAGCDRADGVRGLGGFQPERADVPHGAARAVRVPVRRTGRGGGGSPAGRSSLRE